MTLIVCFHFYKLVYKQSHDKAHDQQYHTYGRAVAEFVKLKCLSIHMCCQDVSLVSKEAFGNHVIYKIEELERSDGVK